MVDKVDNPRPEDEPRMTLNYSGIPEQLPGTFQELSSRVHDHLADPRHRALFAADLKHAYFSVLIHPNDRHYFAFTIPGIGQLQPTRMHQGSKSAGFTMTELVYKAFGELPDHNESSLLHATSSVDLPPLVCYMDDFFGGFACWQDLYYFLRDHFLPRIEWSGLRLSFTKLKLFARELLAVGVVHSVGGHVNIKPERIARIAEWPVPCDKTDVRAFLGAVGFTRRWVKNFTEIARPFTRLCGSKAEWSWGEAEQLSFDLLKIKCATKASVFGVDFSRPIHIYTDASGFAAGAVVTQFQPAKDIDGAGEGLIEVPVIYDSFAFTRTRAKYPTYKRELYAIEVFTGKFDYLCKHPYNTTVVHTDHKPLIHFLESDLYEGIYGHWADNLRRLNIRIEHIPGHRNKVADGLSRTLFDADCNNKERIREAQHLLDREGAQWVWKDGKGGFEEFLKSLQPTERLEVISNGTLNTVSVFNAEAVVDTSWSEAYKTSQWFGDIYEVLEGTKSPSAALLRRSFDYRLAEAIL